MRYLWGVLRGILLAIGAAIMAVGLVFVWMSGVVDEELEG